MAALPEYIESTIALFRAAAEANLATPFRTGNLIDVSPSSGDDVMVTGDLHGHRRNFNLIRRIAGLETLPRRHLVMQEACHGGPTYPQNGGCMSHTVLEDIARLTVKFPGRVHFLLGNHELAEVTDYPIQKNRQMLNLMFRMGLEQMYGPGSDASGMPCWTTSRRVRWRCGLPMAFSSAIAYPRDSTSGLSIIRSSAAL